MQLLKETSARRQPQRLVCADLRQYGVAGVGEAAAVARRNSVLRAMRHLVRCCQDVLDSMHAAAHEQARQLYVLAQLQRSTEELLLRLQRRRRRRR